MREIKFRAWDKTNTERGPAFVDGINNLSYSDDSEHKYVVTGGPWFELIQWNNTIIEQFTGLKDKNGMEIYEGDIVEGQVEYPQLLTGDTDENSNVKMCGTVFYDHSGFSLKVIQSKCDPERYGLVNYFSFIGDDQEIFSEMLVIGNIHQNPELLK